MERWDDLRYLLAVKKAGTMSGAARLLGANVGTVSRRIERLGTELGVQPFLKTPEGWQPNPAMHGLLEAATDFENRIQVEVNRSGEASGDRQIPVKIDSPPMISSMFLFPGLDRLRAAAPEIFLTVSNSSFNTTLGDNDLIITGSLPERGRLMTRKVGFIGFNVYKGPDAVAEGDWMGLMPEFDEAPPVRMAHDHFRTPPCVRLENFYFLAEAMRVTGLPGPLPDLLARRTGGFERIGDDHLRCTTDIFVCYHETRRGDRIIETLVDWIHKSFLADGWVD